MILAAGRGNRLKPLTDTCPKPLIQVAGKPLIVYHIENLKKAGIQDIVINVFHLKEKIISFLGNGSQWGVNIVYSEEETLLETGGGICNALPLLGEKAFILVNGDIFTDFSFNTLLNKPEAGNTENSSEKSIYPQQMSILAHIVLVNNPSHNLTGDYSLKENGQVSKNEETKTYTYSGIALLQPELFSGYKAQMTFRLPLLFERAINQNRIFGEVFQGDWSDVGTIERLKKLENMILG